MFPCSFLETSLDQSLTSNLLILGLNVVILIYNLAQLRRRNEAATGTQLQGRWSYVILLLLPVIHALLAPLFYKFYSSYLLILKPFVNWVNVLGLRAYMSVLATACGGNFVIQESLELVAYADGYVKLFCCGSFRSLWNMYVFLDWATYLLFLQPFFAIIDHYVNGTHDAQTSWVLLSLDILVCGFVMLAVTRLTWVLREICQLPNQGLKLLYIVLVVLTTQVQWSIIACLIHVNGCNEESALQGLAYLMAIEMVILGGIGAVSFPLADLLHVSIKMLELKGQGIHHMGHERRRSSRRSFLGLVTAPAKETDQEDNEIDIVF